MAQAPAPQLQHPFARYASGVAPFLAVVAQFGLIVLVVNDWQLENQLLSRLMALAFAGFIIHHLLSFRGKVGASYHRAWTPITREQAVRASVQIAPTWTQDHFGRR
jgi:hypothetical protein